MSKEIIIVDALLDIDKNYFAKDSKKENKYILHIEDVDEKKYVIKIINFRIVDWRNGIDNPKVLADNM